MPDQNLKCVHCGRERLHRPPTYRHVCYQACADWQRHGGANYLTQALVQMIGLRNLKGGR